MSHIQVLKVKGIAGLYPFHQKFFKRRFGMKKFTLILITTIGVLVASAVVAMAETKSSGNQLMKGYVPWYQKAAVIGQAPALKTGTGSLLALQNTSSLYLEGDSTLHKYQMHANTLKGAVVVGGQGDLVKALKAGEVKAMTLIVPVNDLKSREKGLDENAYKALNAKDNPEIKFVLKSETLKPGKDAETFTMVAKGTLSISGTEQPITLTGEATFKGKSVQFKGVQKLKMSDFGVKPPSISLLVTSINCTDEIQIHYDVTFAAK